jgi:hypothetical protein
VCVVEALHDELRKSSQRLGIAWLADREHQADRLSQHAARHEAKRLRRGSVEPLRVVHDADDRSLLGLLGEQAEHCQAHQEAIRGLATAQAECCHERISLWARKAVDPVHQRRTELVQRRICELHLELGSSSPQNATAAGPAYQVLQQRGLADTGFASQDECSAVTRPHPVQQPIQRLALAAPTTQ